MDARGVMGWYRVCVGVSSVGLCGFVVWGLLKCGGSVCVCCVCRSVWGRCVVVGWDRCVG